LAVEVPLERLARCQGVSLREIDGRFPHRFSRFLSADKKLCSPGVGKPLMEPP
jgi:hypothetical protein